MRSSELPLEKLAARQTRTALLGAGSLLVALLAASGGAEALFAPELEVPELPPTTVTGRWAGFWADTAGAEFEDNVANPNCKYGADLVLDLVESGSSVTGVLTLTVRESRKLPPATTLPCIPVGTVSEQGLSGIVTPDSISFTLADGVTKFDGERFPDHMGGEFSSPTTPQFVGVKGDWLVFPAD